LALRNIPRHPILTYDRLRSVVELVAFRRLGLIDAIPAVGTGHVVGTALFLHARVEGRCRVSEGLAGADLPILRARVASAISGRGTHEAKVAEFRGVIAGSDKDRLRDRVRAERMCAGFADTAHQIVRFDIAALQVVKLLVANGVRRRVPEQLLAELVERRRYGVRATEGVYDFHHVVTGRNRTCKTSSAFHRSRRSWTAFRRSLATVRLSGKSACRPGSRQYPAGKATAPGCRPRSLNR